MDCKPQIADEGELLTQEAGSMIRSEQDNADPREYTSYQKFTSVKSMMEGILSTCERMVRPFTVLSSDSSRNFEIGFSVMDGERNIHVFVIQLPDFRNDPDTNKWSDPIKRNHWAISVHRLIRQREEDRDKIL